MYGAAFAYDSFIGHMEFIFTGEEPYQIAEDLKEVRDPNEIMETLGMFHFESQEQVDDANRFADFVERLEGGSLSIQDFLKIHVTTDDGLLHCLGIATGEAEIAKLREAYPKAF